MKPLVARKLAVRHTPHHQRMSGNGKFCFLWLPLHLLQASMIDCHSQLAASLHGLGLSGHICPVHHLSVVGCPVSDCHYPYLLRCQFLYMYYLRMN